MLFVYATHALNVVMVAPGNVELSTSPPQRIGVYVPPTTRSKSTRYRGKYLIKNSGLASQLWPEKIISFSIFHKNMKEDKKKSTFVEGSCNLALWSYRERKKEIQIDNKNER